MGKENLLEIEKITKSFPGVKALSEVSLSVKAGSVHALMGENGAGKSTLMKCLFGVYEKDSGQIRLDGETVDFKSPAQALLGGVAMVHQELNQAGKLTVWENIFLGRFIKKFSHTPFINASEMRRRAKEIFESLGLDIDPDHTVESLPVSKRQMVEIAKAYSYDAKIYVFDEPTSSLSKEECDRLFRIINALKAKGCGIIYISHKMEEILRICDEVTVLRDGEYVATKAASELTTEKIIKLMVGRDLSARYPPKDSETQGPLLRVEGMSGEYNSLQNVTFTLHKGEILGLAGLDGAGRTELLETLFGLAKRRSGSIYLDEKQIYNRSCKESIRNGFALVTEERRTTGIFGNLSVKENTVCSSLREYLKGPFISEGLIRKRVKECIESINIKTPSQDTAIRTLSGGNQQKVIFCRWMLTEPTVLLLDEPTRGIDVLAKYEIYKLIRSLAKRQKGIILVSSETAELLGMCDRILVMSGGRIAGELLPEAGEEEIIKLAYKYV